MYGHSSDSVAVQLETAAKTSVEQNYPMAQACSFGLGGPARYFCAPPHAAALLNLLKIARALKLDYTIIGAGSNLLVRDEGYPGLVIGTKNLNQLVVSADHVLQVGAGLKNSDLTIKTLELTLSGFEWAAGLPGTVGGGIYMNAKCYGGCYADLVKKVVVLTPEGEQAVLAPAECEFQYKTSIFQKKPFIILEVHLGLQPGKKEAMLAAIYKHMQDRENKHQFQYPSAGCVFKNVPGHALSAGALIAACGLKGLRVGGVRVFEHHANFIVNTDKGRATDVLRLMTKMQQEVAQRFGISLEPEIRIIP